MAKGKKIKRKEKKGNENEKKDKPDDNAVNGKENEERHDGSFITLFKKDELQEIRTVLSVKSLTDNHMLLGAVVLGKFDVVKKLLKQGSPINYAGLDNMTSLMWAVKCKRLEMMDLLIRRGADTSAIDVNGNSALLIAIQSTEWDQDTFLDFWHSIRESSSALLNQSNKTGCTVLHYAVKRQWDSVLEEFIDKGADVNCVNVRGVTPLMMAGSRDDSTTVSKLLRAKADLSKEDKRGCTALCYAIAYMIQKRLETPNPSLQQFIETINDVASPFTLELYLKRRLDLLVYPPEDNFSNTIMTLITHIVTFFVRYIQAGLELLLELQVFVRVREATERHIEDIDYVLALLAVTLELVRSCKCCIMDNAQEKIVKSFIDAGVPETCLNILKKHGLTPLSNNIMNAALIPIMAICTSELGRLWLQRNFSNVQPFYQKYLRTSIISFNILADEYHTRLLKRNIKEFQTLMHRIESGEVIAEEPPPPKKVEFLCGTKLESFQKSMIHDNHAKDGLKTATSIEEEYVQRMPCDAGANATNNQTNSMNKRQKMSITLQDELGCIYNKRNSVGVDNSLSQDEVFSHDETNKMKRNSDVRKILYHQKSMKSLHKPLNDAEDNIKVSKILQPNRLKAGETFSSVLQQNLNREKYAAILRQSNSLGIPAKLSAATIKGNGDCVVMTTNDQKSVNSEKCTALRNMELDLYNQRKINKLKSVFVANVPNMCNGLYKSRRDDAGNSTDEDVIIENEFEDSLSTKLNQNELDERADSESVGMSIPLDDSDNEDNDNTSQEYEESCGDQRGAGGDDNELTATNSSACVSSDECKYMLLLIDRLIKKIIENYETLWKNDWENGYMNAKGGPDVIVELMVKLPNYEQIHLQRLINIWKFLKDTMCKHNNRETKIKAIYFKKLQNYLKNYSLKLEKQVNNMFEEEEEVEEEGVDEEERWYDADNSHKELVESIKKTSQYPKSVLRSTGDDVGCDGNVLKPKEQEKRTSVTLLKRTTDLPFDQVNEEDEEYEEERSDKDKNVDNAVKSQCQLKLKTTIDDDKTCESSNVKAIEINIREEKYHESKWIWNNGHDILFQTSKSMVTIKKSKNAAAAAAAAADIDRTRITMTESNSIMKTIAQESTHSSVSYRPILKRNDIIDANEANCEVTSCRAILKRNDRLKPNCSVPSIKNCVTQKSDNSTETVKLSVLPPPPGFLPLPSTEIITQKTDDCISRDATIRERQKVYCSFRHIDKIANLRAMTPLKCQNYESGALTVASPDTYPEFKLFDGGNFGSVELGLDHEGQPLAVKRFTCFNTKGNKLTGELLKTLVIEMLNLKHDHLLPYSLCIDTEEQILIATPLCERNLKDHIINLKEANLLQTYALEIVKQILEGLHYLHYLKNTIVHGNLKPTNVMVDCHGIVRLTDFGLQKVLYKQMCPLGTTAIWWAQETYYIYQATWQVVCTLKSDVQVAGVLMHYVLTGGLHPFGVESINILENLTAGLPSLRTVMGCDVNDLLSWMLVHAPSDRPNIEDSLRHICFWPNARKWDFILACCGLNNDKSKSTLPMNDFFSFINRRATEEKSTGDWVSIVVENIPSLLTNGKFDTDNPSGLLHFINYCVQTSNLYNELKMFFLKAFPNLALWLYRLIEDSTWLSHPALVKFTLWTPSQAR